MNMNSACNTIIAAFQHKACLVDMIGFSFGVPVLIVIAIIGFYIAGMMISTRRNRRWAADRPHMSTREFLDAIGAESRYDALCLAMREEMANEVKVPVEVIYPSDSMEFLYSLIYDGYDTVQMIVAVEHELNISIPDRIAEKAPVSADGATLADCINAFIGCEEFVALLPVEEPSAGG